MDRRNKIPSTMRYRDGRMTTEEVIAEVEWLLNGNVHPEQIATQLGRSLSGLESLFRSKGRRDLSRIFNVVVMQNRSRREGSS